MTDEWWSEWNFWSCKAEWKASPKLVQHYGTSYTQDPGKFRLNLEYIVGRVRRLAHCCSQAYKLWNTSGVFLLLNKLDIFVFYSSSCLVDFSLSECTVYNFEDNLLVIMVFVFYQNLQCSICGVADPLHISWNHFLALAWIPFVWCCFSHNASLLNAIHVGHVRWHNANHTLFPWQRWLAGPVSTARWYVSSM